jgi:aminoglycoside phosphotransferase (APT) family kinase protein
MSRDRDPEEVVEVLVPADPPEVTPRVARALFDILVELTSVPLLDRPAEGDSDAR